MFKIYHWINCKSSFVIYLLEWYICNIQYAGKSETPFNIRLNNHRKYVKNSNAIPASKHFNKHDHDFNNHGKVIIIKQPRNISTTSTGTLQEALKQPENFWIMKLEILAPHSLNQDLNWIHFMQIFRSSSSFLYIYIHIYIHTYTYIYINTYIRIYMKNLYRTKDCPVLQNTSDLFPENLLKLIPRTIRSAECFCYLAINEQYFSCKWKEQRQLNFSYEWPAVIS